MTEDSQRFSHLVVIGSSAGGIESLSAVAAALPPTFTAPIVMAQHLSPTRPSALVEILERRGPLPVRTIDERTVLEPGVIYVAPPHRDVVVRDDKLELRDEGQSPQPSIDLLFSSAAEAMGEDVIAVVLSGTGSDGAAGARDVKYAGGTVIIQDPESAAYPGMPLSLAPSIVDIVASQERIGEVLTALVTGEFQISEASARNHFQTLLDELREHSGIDFSTYKQPTIERRLQRRIVATGQSSIADYVRHLHHNPDERQRLMSSFLIKVTEFFRDPELYAYLAQDVLPELVRDAEASGSGIRIWSAGCATGEEAYSVAMTIADLLGEDHDLSNVRVFATDLDGDAVAFARRGIYSSRALDNLSPELVARYFIPQGDEYEINRRLRSMLVFGEHDLGQRSPFPRIDLILCRNVLIYFTPALQRRALQLFAFSLRIGGYLVLGKSETVNSMADVFTLDQPRLKSYRRAGERSKVLPTTAGSPLPFASVSARRGGGTPRAPQPSLVNRETARSRPATGTGDQILFELPVAVVVVDERYDVHSLNSEARRLFGIHTTALGQDFIHLLHHFDAAEIRRVIDAARASGERTDRLLESVDAPAEAHRSVAVTCIPQSRGEGDALYVLTAIDRTEREQLRQRQATADEVTERLTRANEEVLAANQDLAYEIVRLRAENEELLVAAEEIQAATEEVETLNEELQASNEELETLNEELQATVEELNTTNDDLQAKTIEMQLVVIDAESTRQELRSVIDGVDAAVVVVDDKGRLILQNAAYFALVADNKDAVIVGGDHKPVPEADLPVQRAMRGEQFAMRFGYAQADHERWYVATGNITSTTGGSTLGIVTIREEHNDPVPRQTQSAPGHE